MQINITNVCCNGRLIVLRDGYASATTNHKSNYFLKQLISFLILLKGQHIAKEGGVACPACDFLCLKPEMEK